MLVDDKVLLHKHVLTRAIKDASFAQEVITKLPMGTFDYNPTYERIFLLLRNIYRTRRESISEKELLVEMEDRLNRDNKMNTNRSVTEEEREETYDTIQSLYEHSEEDFDSENSNSPGFLNDKIESFVKTTLRTKLLYDSVKKFGDNEFMENEFPNKLREIEMIDINGTGDGFIHLLDDWDKKRELYKKLEVNAIPTGYRDLDLVTNGGIKKGSLAMVIASSGSGKSLSLSNLASNYLRQGKNVIYLTLEDDVAEVNFKMDQILFRQSKSKIMTGNKLNEEFYSALETAIKKNRHKYGNISYRSFLPRQLTPSKLDSIISDYIINEGMEPDVLIFDYPDLMDNPFEKYMSTSDAGGKLFEEIRAIGKKYNLLTWVASQTNRTANGAEKVTREHIEGAAKKVNTCELVIVNNQTEDEFKNGYLRWYLDKIRSQRGDYRDEFIYLKVEPDKMLLRDQTDEERDHHADILEDTRMGSHSDKKGYGRGKQDERQMKDNVNDVATNFNSYVTGSREA